MGRDLDLTQSKKVRARRQRVSELRITTISLAVRALTSESRREVREASESSVSREMVLLTGEDEVPGLLREEGLLLRWGTESRAFLRVGEIHMRAGGGLSKNSVERGCN